MTKRSLLPVAMLALMASGAPVVAAPQVEVVAMSDVEYQPLNPLRGDAGPKAGVLWGDIKENVPTGTLIQFADGFSSPPHIHNITYRAVVIQGDVHNDDPGAEIMWMGPGSFWTQPAGQNHITAARKGTKGTAFLEILEGPYLVRPASEEFDTGERPINIEAKNIVWLDASDVSWINASGSLDPESTPQIAFLWGNPDGNEKNGTFLKLPAGFSGELRGNDSWLRAVLISGQATYEKSAGETKTLDPGSYFGADGSASHAVSCGTGGDCVFYISTEGKFQVGAS